MSRTRLTVAALAAFLLVLAAPRDAEAFFGDVIVLTIVGAGVGTAAETVALGSSVYFLASGERQSAGWAAFNTVTGLGTMAVGVVAFMEPFQEPAHAAPVLGVPFLVVGAAQSLYALESFFSRAPPPDPTTMRLVPMPHGLALIRAW